MKASMLRRIDHPETFIHDTGELHDSEILRVEWDVSQHRVSIGLDDLNSNFEGLPEYRGLMPADLVFDQVTAFSVLVDPATDQRHIYGIDISKVSDAYDVVIHTSPGGTITLSCKELLLEEKMGGA